MPLQGITMPPPSGGLNLVAPLDQMEPQDALELVNVFPGAGSPTLRNGYQKVSTTGASIGAAIRTTSELVLADASRQLIVATGTQLYSMSTAGVVTDISKSGNYTNGEWQHVVFNNRIYLCNGVDNAQVYSGVPATPAADLTFTGVALSDLIAVTAYRGRLYFAQKNTAKVWYADFQQTGTAGSPSLVSTDFSFVFRQGGFLVAIGTYSSTISSNTQEFFWAMSSQGEIVFYTGTFPGDSSWQIVKSAFVGKPLGRRAFIQVNNDVWIITAQGIVPISAMFSTDATTAVNLISNKINPLISQYASANPFSSMWDGFFYPEGRAVYITVPYNTAEAFFLVYSIDNQAWTTYQLYSPAHAISSVIFNNKPFFGAADGNLWQGDTGYRDAVDGASSQSIPFTIKTAFNFYGSRGNFKTWKDIRPIIKAIPGVVLRFAFHTDFKDFGTVSPITITQASGQFTPWSVPGGSPGSVGFTAWGSPWSSPVEHIYNRFAASGQGHCAAIKLTGSADNTTVNFIAFEVRYEIGGQV